MRRYVGLDAHSKNSVFVIQDETGQEVGFGRVPTTTEGLLTLRQSHALPEGTPVALESGTMAFFVARRLTALGLAPVVIDAAEVRAKASRPNQKNDRRDARELCEGVRRGIYRSIVHVPPEPIERLRETISRRRHFVRMRTMQIHAMKHLLRTAGSATSTRLLTSEKAWQRLEASLADAPSLAVFCRSHHALWRSANEQVLALDAALETLGQPYREQLDRLATVPGVGRIVALTAVATFSDITRFSSAKHAASYAGVVPSTYDSGESVRHGRITRRGSGELRSMLCEAAHHARSTTNPFHPYFAALVARRGYKMAVMAVAHRICRILYAMLRHGTTFDLERLGVEEGTFEKTIVRKYRRRKLTPA